MRLENKTSEFIGFKAFEFAFVDFQHVENRRGYGEGSCTFRFLIAPWSPDSGAGEFHELKLKTRDSCGPFSAGEFALPGIEYAQIGMDPVNESLYLKMNVKSDAKGEKIMFLEDLFFRFGLTAQLVSDSVNLVVMPMYLDQQLIEKEKWRIKEEFTSIHRDTKGDKYMFAFDFDSFSSEAYATLDECEQAKSKWVPVNPRVEPEPGRNYYYLGDPNAKECSRITALMDGKLFTSPFGCKDAIGEWKRSSDTVGQEREIKRLSCEPFHVPKDFKVGL